jgi:hypothetical protein
MDSEKMNGIEYCKSNPNLYSIVHCVSVRRWDLKSFK